MGTQISSVEICESNHKINAHYIISWHSFLFNIILKIVIKYIRWIDLICMSFLSTCRLVIFTRNWKNKIFSAYIFSHRFASTDRIIRTAYLKWWLRVNNNVNQSPLSMIEKEKDFFGIISFLERRKWINYWILFREFANLITRCL